jgi:Fe2+ or Zn2+ uptake regulation protein
MLLFIDLLRALVMTFSSDMDRELNPITTLYRFKCDECGEIIEYEDYENSPLKETCALCEYKLTHSAIEIETLNYFITEIKKNRKSKYRVVEDAIYIMELQKMNMGELS